MRDEAIKNICFSFFSLAALPSVSISSRLINSSGTLYSKCRRSSSTNFSVSPGSYQPAVHFILCSCKTSIANRKLCILQSRHQKRGYPVCSRPAAAARQSPALQTSQSNQQRGCNQCAIGVANNWWKPAVPVK